MQRALTRILAIAAVLTVSPLAAALQISLDGGPDLHNKTRHLLNGKPTYDRILQNVDHACDQLGVYLRVNVDADNHHAVPGLIDDLVSRNLKDRVYIYFARVDEVNENSMDHHDSCLSARRYAEVEASLIRLALDKGLRLGKRLVEPSSTFCGANSVNCYVVDSEANLLKCYHGLGEADAHRIGEIGVDGEEIVTDSSRLLNWLSWDPFEKEECRSCKVLPICMGGCSDKIVSRMNIEEGCRSLRFSLDDTVENSAGVALRKLSATTDCAECAAVPAAVACGP
ncbi:MAG: SPASM domain-containing protein [bacterium]|nr:SPASM domain-containing protein [bacterium]